MTAPERVGLAKVRLANGLVIQATVYRASDGTYFTKRFGKTVRRLGTPVSHGRKGQPIEWEEAA